MLTLDVILMSSRCLLFIMKFTQRQRLRQRKSPRLLRPRKSPWLLRARKRQRLNLRLCHRRQRGESHCLRWHCSHEYVLLMFYDVSVMFIWCFFFRLMICSHVSYDVSACLEFSPGEIRTSQALPMFWRGRAGVAEATCWGSAMMVDYYACIESQALSVLCS